MKLDLKELRKIANMATQGEWQESEDVRGAIVAKSDIRMNLFGIDQEGYAIVIDKPNIKHIAAFNPQTALALIELIEEAEVLLTTVPDGRFTDAWRKKAGFK